MIEQPAIAAEEQSRAGIRDVIQNRDFVKLWVAQILSQTAQQIVNMALVLQVTELTSSGTAVSGIIISFTIPAILFAAIAGVFVERNSKKTMLVITNVLRGVLVLAYLLADPAWGLGAVLPIFYVVTLLFSSVSQFFNPAEASLIPLLVKRSQLVAANSLFNLTLSATQLGGFVVLGPLLLNTIFHNNYNGLYIVISVLCMLAALSTWLLPQDKPEDTAAARRKKGEKVNVSNVAAGASEIARSGFRTALDELAEGWAFIRRDPVIMNAILYWSIAIAVFMMLGAIGPPYLKVAMGIDSSKLFYILLPGGIGLVVGVLIIGRIATPANREAMINISLLAAGALLLAFAAIYPTLTWLFANVLDNAAPEVLVLGTLGVLTFFLGLFNSFISVPAQTALQERSPENVRARVFSAFFTISNAILIVPVFFAGALADGIGYTQTIVLIGFAVLLIAGWGFWRSRHRRAAARDTANGHMNGHVTVEEAEAALTAASPAPRPIMAREIQEHAEQAERAEHAERAEKASGPGDRGA
ncbi:MAG TPA: MFS transporter [Chloroflexia bacterium]|nr:MFS transporter [Chloroflexia bacterium]